MLFSGLLQGGESTLAAIDRIRLGKGEERVRLGHPRTGGESLYRGTDLRQRFAPVMPPV